jgi:hypothetical protein
MRIKCILVVLPLLSGCASAPIQYSCDETCALQGMVCTGQAMGASSGSTYVPDQSGKTFGTVISSSSGSSTVFCSKDDSKQAQINHHLKATRFKVVIDDHTTKCAKWKRSLDKEWDQTCAKQWTEISSEYPEFITQAPK